MQVQNINAPVFHACISQHSIPYFNRQQQHSPPPERPDFPARAAQRTELLCNLPFEGFRQGRRLWICRDLDRVHLTICPSCPRPENRHVPTAIITHWRFEYHPNSRFANVSIFLATIPRNYQSFFLPHSSFTTQITSRKLTSPHRAAYGGLLRVPPRMAIARTAIPTKRLMRANTTHASTCAWLRTLISVALRMISCWISDCARKTRRTCCICKHVVRISSINLFYRAHPRSLSPFHPEPGKSANPSKGR